MLIIAIPKSASTSLLNTLGKIHNLKTIQSNKFQDNLNPTGTQILHKYHTDVRRLKEENVIQFKNEGLIFKQHIYPSANNQLLLKSVKKVVLLRNVKEIVLAYRRGIKKKVHNQIEGFSEELNEEEWIKNANKIGLSRDLENFYGLWNNSKDEFTLIVHYENLISNPKKEINRIENFFDLEQTKGEIKLSKKRYTRQSKLKITISNLILRIKRLIVKTTNNITGINS